VRRLIALGSLVLLSGCAGLFAPAYDATLDASATSAYAAAAKIAAEIQLGQFVVPTSYAGAAEQYVTLIAAIAVAKQRALTAPTSSGIAQDARQHLANVLQGCADRAQTLAGLHQKAGLQPATGEDSDLLTACSQAANAASALKP
jgi:hypothetical protein